MATLTPIDFDPRDLSMDLTPIDFDPRITQPSLTPVDFNPRKETFRHPAPLPPEYDPFDNPPPSPLENYLKESWSSLIQDPRPQLESLFIDPLREAYEKAGQNIAQARKYQQQGITQAQQPDFHNTIAGYAKGALGELGAITGAINPYLGASFDIFSRVAEATGHPEMHFRQGKFRTKAVEPASATRALLPQREAMGMPVRPLEAQELLAAKKEPVRPPLRPEITPEIADKAQDFLRWKKEQRLPPMSPLPEPVAQAAGAAPAPPRITPTRAGMLEVENRLHQNLTARPGAYLEEARKKLIVIPEELRRPEIERELHTALQPTGDMKILSAPARRLYDEHIASMKKEYDTTMYAVRKRKAELNLTDDEVQALEIDLEGPPRMSLDHARFMESATAGTPLRRGEVGKDSTGHYSTEYDVLENDVGERIVVLKSPKTFTNIMTGEKFKHDINITEYGHKVSDKEGTTWTLKSANEEEIEAARHFATGGTGAAEDLYLKSPSIVYAYQTAAAKSMEDRLEALWMLKNSLETTDFIKDSFHAPKDWKSTKFPGLQRFKVHPRVAEVLEDFTTKEHTGSLWEKFENASHWVTSTIFLTGGLPHLLNVAGHAGMAASWRMFDPRYFGKNWGKAWYDVTNGSELYQQVLKEGGPLFFHTVRNQDFARHFMKEFGQQIRVNPTGTGFKAFAGRFGLTTRELYRSYARHMNASLWHGGDVIAMQSIRSLIDRGYSLRDALKLIDDIPNYRVPSRLWEGPGGRLASQFLKYTPLNVFGRYHYNISNGFYKLAKELAVGTKEEKINAIGKVVALAAMYTGFNLFSDYLEQSALKDPKGHALESIYPGPLGAMHTVEGWLPRQTKSGQWTAAGRNPDVPALLRIMGFAPSPTFSTAAGALTGADFASRGIYRPGDPMYAKGTQLADYALQNLISPIGQTQSLLGSGPYGSTFGQQLTSSMLHSGALVHKKPPLGGWAALSARSPLRATRPVGPIESLVTRRKYGSMPRIKRVIIEE